MIGEVVVGALVAMGIFLYWSASRTFMAGESIAMNVLFAGIASVLFGVATAIVLAVFL